MPSTQQPVIAQHGNFLYALAGLTVSNSTLTNVFARRNLTTNVWTALNPTLKPVAAYGRASVCLSDRWIISGGRTVLTPSAYSAAVYSFDFTSETWTVLPDMPVALAFHSMFEQGGAIYVFGGWRLSPTSALNDRIYELKDGVWRDVSKLVTPLTSSLVVYDSSVVYSLGGSTGSAAAVDAVNTTFKLNRV